MHGLFAVGNVHWVCVSCDEAENIDSNSTMGISIETVLQVAKIYSIPSNHSSLKVRRLSVQQQLGACDCGLFSIAYAIELCSGWDPESACFAQERPFT